MHFSTRFVWRLCVPAGLTMDSDPPIWEPDMPAHFFVNAGPAFHLCSSSFPGPPAVEGPSAEHTVSLAAERIGPMPQTWIGDRPTRSGTNSTFCAVLRSVCGPFLSGWGVGTLTGSTAGQPVRTARHLALRSTPTRKPQLHGHGGGWVAPPTSHPLRPNQPSSTTGTVYDRLGLPAGPTDVRPMGSVQNCGIPVHTVSYRRHHVEGDALPFPPADRSSRICPRTT